MYSRFFVVLKCTVQGGPKVNVLLIAFLQLGYGWNFETVYWQILGRSGKKIILLSSLIKWHSKNQINYSELSLFQDFHKFLVLNLNFEGVQTHVLPAPANTVEIRVLLPRRFNLFIRGTLIAATTAQGSWRSYFTASVERAFLLSLLRVLYTALCFCRW